LGRTTDALKWVGSKAASGVKVTGSAIGKQIDVAVAEQKRKSNIYKEEFQKAVKEEKESLRKDKDEALRRKAREDAKKKVRGVPREARKE